MGRIVYAMNVSLDGYINRADGSIDWSVVDEEILGWFNDLGRATDVMVWGRRNWEIMRAYWPTAHLEPGITPVELEWANLINPMPKVVFSTTLKEVDWNARLATADVAEELTRLRAEYDGLIALAGPTLAAHAIRAGLVDEYRLMVDPVLIGGGTRFFPPDIDLRLRLIETRTFKSGVVYLGYEQLR